MACNHVFVDYINCGVEEIVLDLGLTPNAVMSVVIETPQGAKYVQPGTVDAFGNITLQVADFPEGLFNPYAGAFTVHIDTGCNDTLFCDYYKYIQFEAVNGNQGKNTLSCCAPGATSPTATCCTTTTEVFTNEAVTIVPYTGTRPSIEVAYLNLDGTFTLAGVSTTVTFDANQFTIDHGGIASGIIKLLK